MGYFVISDGTVLGAFDTLEEARAAAGDFPGSRVVGEEWTALGTVKNRVSEARQLLDEVRELIDRDELERMREALRQLDALLDASIERLGTSEQTHPEP